MAPEEIRNFAAFANHRYQVPVVVLVESADIPAGMTIPEYRRSRAHSRPKRGLRRLSRLVR